MAQKLLSTQDVKGGMKLFLLLLFLARWAEVEGNNCGSGAVPQIGSKRPQPAALLQSRILLKTSLVDCAWGCVWRGTRRLLPSAKVVQQEFTACICWVGGIVSISPSTYVLRLWVNGKQAQ